VASEPADSPPSKEATMATLLRSAVTPSDGDAIVTVRGDLDADTAPQLWTHLRYLIGQCHYQIVLDLAGVVLLDSAGVDVIVRAAAWTRQQDGSLVVRSASPAAAELLDHAGLTRAAATGPPGGRLAGAARGHGWVPRVEANTGCGLASLRLLRDAHVCRSPTSQMATRLRPHPMR
jgi:stage II sporulation protein AA (anti-sigma F factor antagonist)